MFVNKTYNLTLSEPKEETYLLGEFEDVKFAQLQKPLTLVKDAPPPPAVEKNEEKKRKFYKKSVQNATYLLSSGEKPVNPPRLDPKTNAMITSEPMMTMKSRRYKDDDRYAVICLEEGQSQTITVLDEKWVFTKNTVAMAPSKVKIEDIPVYQDDEKEKPKRKRGGDNSEDESYSHQSDKFADDDDDYNKKHRPSQSDSYNDSESEMDENPEIAEIKQQKAKKREEEEKMSRKRKYEGMIQPPEAKRNFEDMKKIIQNILKKNGEMLLDDFITEIGPVDYAFISKDEYGKELYKFTEISGEGRNTTISLKKEVPKRTTKGQSRQKKQPPKK